MTVMTAAEIARALRRHASTAIADARVDAWAFDSRALDAGACFVALRGDRDGHDFVARRVRRRRARRARRPRGCPTRATARRAARSCGRRRAPARCRTSPGRCARERPELRVVAVAGSTGKTSTKDLLAAVLAPARLLREPRVVQQRVRAPAHAAATRRRRRGWSSTEMGERLPGDLALLCDIARPHVGVVTNVGLAHAEHLGGPEGAADGDRRAARRAAGRRASRC